MYWPMPFCLARSSIFLYTEIGIEILAICIDVLMNLYVCPPPPNPWFCLPRPWFRGQYVTAERSRRQLGRTPEAQCIFIIRYPMFSLLLPHSSALASPSYKSRSSLIRPIQNSILNSSECHCTFCAGKPECRSQNHCFAQIHSKSFHLLNIKGLQAKQIHLF